MLTLTTQGKTATQAPANAHDRARAATTSQHNKGHKHRLSLNEARIATTTPAKGGTGAYAFDRGT